MIEPADSWRPRIVAFLREKILSGFASCSD
jgi:hypothetical protein